MSAGLSGRQPSRLAAPGVWGPSRGRSGPVLPVHLAPIRVSGNEGRAPGTGEWSGSAKAKTSFSPDCSAGRGVLGAAAHRRCWRSACRSPGSRSGSGRSWATTGLSELGWWAFSGRRTNARKKYQGPAQSAQGNIANSPEPKKLTEQKGIF